MSLREVVHARAVGFAVAAVAMTAAGATLAPAEASAKGPRERVENGLIAYTTRSQSCEFDHCPGPVRVIRPDGSGGRRLACSVEPREMCYDNEPAFSPDGRFLAVTHARLVRPFGEVIIVRRLNGTGRRVAASKGSGVIDDITWSGDGRKIAFAQFPEVRIVDLDDLSVRLFRRTGSDDISWSSQGRLAWSSERREGLFLTDRSRRHVRRLPLQVLHPRWSPDGRRLLDQGGDGVVIRRADGRKLTELKQCDTINARAAWSPDGRQVACRGGVPGKLITVNVATHRTRVVARGLYPEEIAWQRKP